MMPPRDITVGAPGNVTPPFENVIKAAQRNEQQGYDVIWWYDHLMSWWPQSIWTPDLVPPAKLQPNPHIHLDVIATMGAVGVSTERIKLGTSVTDAARRPPAMLAQEFLTLDHITKGRAILGIGAGEACNAAPYGIACNKPVSRMEEALKIIRMLWENDEPIDYEGQFWKLEGAVIGMPPYRPGHYPPIWIGGIAPRTLRILGQLADGWLPTNMPIEEWKQRREAIRQTAIEAGRDPDAITYSVWSYVVTDESHDECHRMLDALLVKDLCVALPWEVFKRHGHSHPLGERAFGMTDYIPSRLSRERALEVINAVPFEVCHEFIIHGTPEEIAEYVEPYIEAGATHIALQNVTFAADERKLSSSFRLMSELVKYIKGLA
jgi:phthiodiolone/phenolphthiodiolone dimycocerosates ketoreductase